MLYISRVSSILVALALATFAASQGSWAALNHQPPAEVTCPILMTDGTVLVQEVLSSNWWRLTPDQNGNYVNGTWTQIASMPADYGPLYHSSAVLQDGRLVVCGGEYNLGANPVWTNKCAVYDPIANHWNSFSPPPGFTQIGDSQCAVLPDGRFVLTNLYYSTAVLAPTTMTWGVFPDTGKSEIYNEEGWTLLPDGRLFTVDCWVPQRIELFNPSTMRWSIGPSTPVSLVDTPTHEIGPAVLLPSGKVFATGGNGHMALYSPGTSTWTSLPDLPIVGGQQMALADAPACLLPNGNVLFAASPVPVTSAGNSTWSPPTRLYEFNGTSYFAVPDTLDAPVEAAYEHSLLILPTGQVLHTHQRSTVEIYTSPGLPLESWRPKITSCPGIAVQANSIRIAGTQFNGLSQGSFYGDDVSNATNYPLVRLTNKASGHIRYCRTRGHSTMGVATGNALTYTNAVIPGDAETGSTSLEVVANGIASTPVDITIQPLAYSVRELGPVVGYASSSVFKMNSSGEAVGWAWNGNPYGANTQWAAVLWSGSRVLDLGHPSGYPLTRATSINARGAVVGAAFKANGNFDEARAFYWDGTQMHLLQPPPGQAMSEAVSINDSGNILVYSGPSIAAYYYASWDSAPVPLPIPAGYDYGAAFHLTNSGLITGYLHDPNSSFNTGVKPCYWSKYTSQPVLYSGSGSWNPTGVNRATDAGLAVGGGYNGSNYGPLIYAGGVGTPLLNYQGHASGAYDINSYGIIAGFYEPGPDYACVWIGGTPYDVTSKVNASVSPGWTLSAAYQINDAGQLLGDGTLNGQNRGFVATPYSQTGGAGLTVNCTAVLGDFIGDADNVPVTFEFTRELTGQLEMTLTVTRDPVTAAYFLPNTLNLRGLFTVRAKASHWLASRAWDVILSDSGGIGADFTLVNGDIDNDNVISIFDYIVLSDYFDKSELDSDWATVGSNGWAPKDADLDGDDVISIFDYIILSDNFDKAGDD